MKLLSFIILLFTANLINAKSVEFLPVPVNDIVRHTYYTLSYNENYEQANWVYYSLTDSMILNSGQERSNSFKMDKSVVSISAKSSDYTNSGYDRGHLCPAGDMGFSELAMQESFLMSNISPQVPDFNRGIWKELESTVRDWAKIERQLYVVTGPVFKNNKDTIGREEVVVPGYYFKIIYDPTDKPKMIAFVLPNEKSDRLLTDYAVTIDKAEQLTGFDFFSQLPDDLENKLEGVVQLSGWFAGYETPEPVATNTKRETATPDLNFYLILVAVLMVVIILVTFMSKKRRRR
ncbi:MAG: DNA/RNA non-specific endonuclease [Prolixibacteraceae bacterium]|nr:DNA/RNA non-specific endonuclease [Prolixibacteraceae bacterium]